MSADEILRFENLWREIYSEGIERVFRIAEAKDSDSIGMKQYTKLYTVAYDICTSKSTLISVKLYERLLETIRVYCQEVYEKVRYSRTLLFDFVLHWTSFEDTVLKWILKLFSILTRENFKLKKNLNLEADLKSLFKEQVFEKIKTELNDSFFLLMNKERQNELLDPSVLKKFIKFLTSIEISYMEFLYNNSFEREILNHSLKFYRPVMSEVWKNNNFSGYLNWALNVLHREETRLSFYLPPKTVNQLILCLKSTFFYAQSKEFLDSPQGLKFLLIHQNFEDLAKTFKVLSEDPKSLQLMLAIFKNYVKEEFKTLIDKNDSLCNFNDGPREVISKTNYIEEFIQFYALHSKIITEAFAGCNVFNVSFKEVLENIQSSNGKFNNSYILPFYIDKNLKRSPNNHSAESSGVIEKALGVFPTLPDKDVFIDIHRNLLSTRILNEDFISLDTEKYLINRLKLLCGVEFTSNLEGILGDYYQNKDLNEKYFMWLKGVEHKPKIETYFSILNHEFWPALNTHQIKIPKEVQHSIDNFQIFYSSNNPKKLLKWSFQSSTAEVEANFDKKYILVVNSIQAIILLCFNNVESGKDLSVNEIMSSIGLPNENEVKALIVPLVITKLIIKGENNSESFRLNHKFTFPSKKVKVMSLPKNDEIVRKEKIEDDRSWAIEATIVRIMKSTKKLHHNDLVKRVLEQMELFKIQINTIKKKLDNLLERELISRDKDDPNFYTYSSN